jgi:hypothetical protein
MSAKQTSKQVLFHDLILGVLIYSVVLGFFNDYTTILYTGTYSTTFAVAVVMQLLTMATFNVKDRVVSSFNGSNKKAALVICVWLVMFFSKFVFLAVIDIVFRSQVEISGFIGLLIMILLVTIIQKIVQLVYEKLGR